eukprot:UN09393
MAAFPSTVNNGDVEGHILTIPKYKKYKNKTPVIEHKNLDDGFRSNDRDIIKLKEFVQKYKLHKLSKKLLREGITVDFLISQTDSEIDVISKELTAKLIQQNKFKFAVKALQKNNLESLKLMIEIQNVIKNAEFEKAETPETPIPNAPSLHVHDKVTAIDTRTETINPTFGNKHIITSWYYKGSDELQHEIIIKHDTKLNKNMKSKRKIIVDGKERYSKKSNDINFV